jgi:hypothetical protein
MSTVIIGGGGGVRIALTAMENASILWTPAQRDQAEKLLDHVKDQINSFTNNPQPPA